MFSIIPINYFFQKIDFLFLKVITFFQIQSLQVVTIKNRFHSFFPPHTHTKKFLKIRQKSPCTFLSFTSSNFLLGQIKFAPTTPNQIIIQIN